MNVKLGILLYENVQSMDVIGPWEVFVFWQKIAPFTLDMCLVAQERGYIHCSNQITLEAHEDFNTCKQLDYFIIPGGQGRLQQVNNDRLINFIKKQAEKCQYLLSVCTGMFLLQKAGLLTQKSATTYWRALPELKAFPDIKLMENRIVKNDKIWTAGGVSSGIDLALALIAEVSGKEEAGKVQLMFEYFPSHEIYCSEETAKYLPTYHSDNKNNEGLPKYIKNYIAGRKE